MTEQETQSQSQPQPQRPGNPALKLLAGTFQVIRDCQPLAIGVHKVIRSRLPDLGDGAIRSALKQHTASTKYLKAIANGKQRYDLDGQPAGEILAEQREQALTTLKERFRKAAERKREEAQAKEHQEKLLKLAEKFNRR